MHAIVLIGVVRICETPTAYTLQYSPKYWRASQHMFAPTTGLQLESIESLQTCANWCETVYGQQVTWMEEPCLIWHPRYSWLVCFKCAVSQTTFASIAKAAVAARTILIMSESPSIRGLCSYTSAVLMLLHTSISRVNLYKLDATMYCAHPIESIGLFALDCLVAGCTSVKRLTCRIISRATSTPTHMHIASRRDKTEAIIHHFSLFPAVWTYRILYILLFSVCHQ